MARPKRLYINSSGKYYYLIDGKKKFIKVPEGMSQKQVQTINIKNIIGETGRRIRRKKKPRQIRYTKKVTRDDMQQAPGLPTYIFQPKKKILSLSEIATGATDTTDNKLINLLEKVLLVNKPAVKADMQTQTKSDVKTDMETQTIGLPPVERKESRDLLEELRERERAAERAQEAIRNQAELLESVRKDLQESAIKYKGSRKIVDDDDEVKIISQKELFPARTPTKPVSAPAPKGTFSKETGVFVSPLSDDTPKDILKRLKKATAKPPVPKQKKKKGKGLDDGDDGLYNDSIEKIMKERLKGLTVPVVAADEVDTLPNHLYNKDFFAAVINTDPSDSGGRHWRCIVIDNRDDFPSAEYFDSLAETFKPEPALLNVMRKICRLMNPEKYMKYKFSKIRRQSYNKSNCGYHVMKFIEDRYNGIPFEEASGYKDYMKGRGSAPDDSQDGEGDLASYERKIKSQFKEYL